jgi:Mg2+/Co2+ transporter CorB
MVGATLGVVGVATVAVLLAFSTFFSSSETAIFSLPTEWFERRAAADDPRGPS